MHVGNKERGRDEGGMDSGRIEPRKEKKSSCLAMGLLDLYQQYLKTT